MTIFELLAASKVIAVVGLSQDPSRPSYGVAERLRRAGYTIVPVNPTITEWNGLACYPSVSAIPQEIIIDIVDVFRRPEFLLEVAHDALTRRPLPKCIWLQQDLADTDVESLAKENGVMYVEDMCLAVEYGYFASSKR